MDTITQIAGSLDRALSASLPYHAHLSTEERENYMEELDANISGVFLWGTTSNEAKWELCEIEALHEFQSTEGGMGVFMYEGTKPGEVNVMTLCAVLAFDRASWGKEALSRGDITEAAAMAMTAHEVLGYGNIANTQTEQIAQQMRKKERKTIATSNAAKIKNAQKYGQAKTLIEEEVEKILREGKQTVKVVYQTPEQLGLSTPKRSTFKLFIKDRLNVEKVADYIYELYVEKPRVLKEPSKINMMRDAIRNYIRELLTVNEKLKLMMQYTVEMHCAGV